jgi:hypothetical protein
MSATQRYMPVAVDFLLRDARVVDQPVEPGLPRLSGGPLSGSVDQASMHPGVVEV